MRYVSWRPAYDHRGHPCLPASDGRGHRGGTEAQWVIEQQGLDGPIGMIGFRLAGHAVELGVRPRAGVLGPRLRHRGGAGGGGLALAEPTVYRVRAVCDVEHCASAHVLDNVGMEDISAGGPRG